MSYDQLIQLHSGRETVYACLSRVFLDIPVGGFFDMLEALYSAVSFMDTEAVAGLEQFLARRRELQSDTLVAFDMEANRKYTQLYCLSNSVPMTESVYASPDGLTMQKAAGEAWRLYQQYGFNMNHGSHEHNDHISYELMFMAYLAKRTALLLTEGDAEKAALLVEVQSAFLTDHLRKWAGNFTAATCAHEASGPLYAPLARLMLRYINEDADLLDLISGGCTASNLI